MRNVRRHLVRAAACVVPCALVLAATGTAVAAPKAGRPTPVLSTKPASVSNVAAPTFAWGVDASKLSDGTVTFTCALDGAAAAACGSIAISNHVATPATASKAYSGLADGSHTFVVKSQMNGAGKQTAASWSFKVDTVAPIAPTLNQLTTPTSNRTAAVSFADSDPGVAGFTCSLDGANAQTCTSPVSYANLVDQLHTVVVTARDAAGNVAARSMSWTVDTLAPNVPNVVPPASPTFQTSAAIDFSGEAGASFTCALDSGAAAACAEPSVSFSGLVDGPHTVDVTSHDGAGNAATGTATWVVDTVAPAAPSLVNSPAAHTVATDAQVDFTDLQLDVVGHTCALDAAPAVACSSPYQAAGLALGLHTLVVRSLDAAGNASTPLSTSWTVDTVSGPAAFVSGPESPSGLTSPVLDWIATDPATTGFQCSLDGGAWSDCNTVPMSVPVSEGAHAFAVRATSDGLNWSDPTVWSWVVDTTGPTLAPVASGSTPPDSGLVTVGPVFAFSNPDPTTITGFACSVDGGAFASCASGVQPAVGDGSHSLVVATVDQAGNLSSSTLTYTWTLDTTPPALTVTPPGSPTSATQVTLGFSSADAVGFTCALDGGAASACTTGQAFGAGQDGTSHTVVVTAADAAGNTAQALATWVVDRTAPRAPTPGNVPPALIASSSVTLTFSAPGADHVVCALDGGVPADCSTGFVTYTGLGDATHTVVITASDLAGNASTMTSTFTVDTRAPLATVTFPRTLTGAVGVSFDEPVAASGVQLRLAGTTTAVPTRTACTPTCAGAGSMTLTPVARLVPGQKYVVVAPLTATDAAGNPVVVPALVHRALQAVQDTDLAMAQGWTPRTSTGALGGRYVQSDLVGATVTYAFRGTAVTWITATGPAMGTVKVYVDNVLKTTVGNYSAAPRWKVARSVIGLSSGAHVLKLVATGQKVTLSKGTDVVVDAVKVGATTTLNPVLGTRWAGVSASSASGRRYAVADEAGAVLSMTFRGTSITWQTVLGRTMGSAKVYVDGQLKGTFSGFASSTKYGVRHTWRLTDKVHTVKVVPTGTHVRGATGNRVAVDLLLVG